MAESAVLGNGLAAVAGPPDESPGAIVYNGPALSQIGTTYQRGTMRAQDAPTAEVATALERLRANVADVLFGKPELIRLALVAVLAEGHLLIEDVPGVGKTLLAKALARSLGCTFHRIQFTPDLLPSDLIGTSVFHQAAASSSSSRARCSPKWCWPTKSIGPRRERNRPCSKP